MTLKPGQSLLHYRLVEKIGEGGMGVVWKAVDTTLEREVAIKILPDAFAADAERMARFEREAKLLGSLNHPNIATIYGLHQAAGCRFIAMEFIPGKDLAHRLAEGAMPQDEVSEVAGQIADALQAAHERAVIHRDLKPANVRLTEDGTVKVLDFGLAKSFGGGPAESNDTDLSPTVTSDSTRDGVILGTAAYMSPEQARGRLVDRRSDVWAFGCLLYECLTGRKAFPGETISDTLAAVLKSEPDWAALPAGTPESLRRLLRRCLAKEPRRRLSSLADARLEIEETAEETVKPPSTSRWSPWLVLPIVGALLIVAMAIFFAGRDIHNSESAISYMRLTHQRGWIRSARISQDGQTLIYSAAWEGQPLQLYLQRLDSTEALAVPLEPGHARLLSISSRGELAILLPPEPDIVLLPRFRGGTLARMPLTGGTPRAVAEEVYEADWDPSGEQFALVRGMKSATQLEYPAGELLYQAPGEISCIRIAPSGDLVAFFDHPFANNNRGTVALVNRDGEMRTLSAELENLEGLAWSPDGSEIWFSGADDVGKALFAVSLSGELRVLRRSAQALKLLDITADGRLLVAQSIFHLGIAARAPGATAERDLSWMGAAFVTDISADGQQILFLRQDQMVYDVWFRRTDGSAPTRLGPGVAMRLSPDDRWAISGSLSVTSPLMLLPTGAGEPRMVDGTVGALYADWTPDGEGLVWAAAGPQGGSRLYVQDLDGRGPLAISEEGIQARIDRPFHVSPDGLWVASMGPENVIKLYPVEGGEPRDLLGTLPGDEPSGWSEDGRAFFVARFGSLPAPILRLDIESGSRSLWRELIPRDPAGTGGLYSFVLTPDGEGYAYTYARHLDSMYLMTGLQ